MTITELREIKDLIDAGNFGTAHALCQKHDVDFDDVETAIRNIDQFKDAREDEDL